MALVLVPCPLQWNKTKIIAQGTTMVFETKLYMDFSRCGKNVMNYTRHFM
jgi:hypothetical protein